MKRTIIKIDEELCFGCGNCVSGCHEGALQMIDGKAIMISDLYCDGLGACIGECPVGAITVEEREAEPYSEIAVMARLIPMGEKAVTAHLKHLKSHGEDKWVSEALDYLKLNGIKMNFAEFMTESNLDEITVPPPSAQAGLTPHIAKNLERLECGCPGSTAREIKPPRSPLSEKGEEGKKSAVSQLRHFPIQLHLIHPDAAFFQNCDLLLAADCTAFASREFHSMFLADKSLVVGCPKLDSKTDIYIEKLTRMIDDSRINTLTVLIMEVPCCRGLVKIAQMARERAVRNIPIKIVVLSVAGEIVDDRWI